MKRFVYSTIGIIGAALLPHLVSAQAGTTPPTASPAKTPSSYFDPGGNIQKNSGLPSTTITDYVFNIISAGLGVLAVVALVLILYAGFTIMTSAGNEDKIATGRQTLIWSVVGLLIIFSSFSILLLFDQII
jgi:hypothetical protein